MPTNPELTKMKCLFGHSWQAAGVSYNIFITRWYAELHPDKKEGEISTKVLYKCFNCAEKKVETIDGEWTLDQLK